MSDVHVHLWAERETGADGASSSEEGRGASRDEGLVVQTRCGRLVAGGMILVAAVEEAEGVGLPVCGACAGARAPGPQRPRGCGALPPPPR